MLKLGAVLLLFLAHSISPAVSQFFASSDDFGQMYVINSVNKITPYGPFMSSKTKTYTIRNKIPLGSVFLAVIVANSGPFTRRNPASFQASSIPKSRPYIVTNSSWKCKGFGGILNPIKFPQSSTAKILLKSLIPVYDRLSFATELSPNWNFLNAPKKNIALGGEQIWPSKALTTNNIPPRAICLLKL